MTWITEMALKKRWLTILLASFVTGASVWAMFTLKMELLPDIELPMTTVLTVYPQAQPDEVVERVTIPVEGTAAGLAGLEQVASTSVEGRSFVFFQFEFGTDMEEVNSIIADRLSKLSLPPEVPTNLPGLGDNPKLLPINVNLMPVVILSLYGDAPVELLRQTALTEVVPRLQSVDGVLNVSIEGGNAGKVLVRPSPEKLAQQGVSAGQLAAALAAQEYDSLGALENAIIRPDGLQLKDVAAVSFGRAPGSSISRTNGRPSVSINVTKDAAANTVKTANAILDEAATIGAELSPGLKLAVIMDQSEYIEASVSDLTVNAVIGSVLAILVVFLFLMAFRASLVTAVSIPLSLLISFLVMRFTNITINILTLSAMIIAVGRVIDNSIVILEVVYRRMQQGEPFADAAINGVREVVAPITSATVATVVVFVPLVFVGGIVGEMFIPFGLTMTFALVGSLLVALTVVPALSGYLIRLKADERPPSSWYLTGYTSALRWCLGHRLATLAIAIVLFLGSFALVPIIGTTFIPQMDTNVLTVTIEMPPGTGLEVTDSVAASAEKVLGAHTDVLTYNTVVGGPAGPGFASIFGGGASNVASIRAIVAPGADVGEVVEELRAQLAGLTSAARITVAPLEAMSEGETSGLEIQVRGNTYEDVATAANLLVRELESAAKGDDQSTGGGLLRRAQRQTLASLANLQVNLPEVRPKLTIKPDLAKLAASGLSMEEMQRLRQEFFMMQQGATVARANLDGAPTEVFLAGMAADLTDADTARALPVGFPKTVPLGDIATVELGDQVTTISRLDGKVSATVTAKITSENVGAVSRAIQSEIDSLDFPGGVEIGMGGITEDMRQSFSAMFVAIGIALPLAYAVLVLTFRSFRGPLIIMVSLPLASIGALLALFLTGRPLGISGLMGILMLVGIVLTNAVVLIAVVEQMRRDGRNTYDALVEGARTRLRPILMTALTTMIAMLPLAFGLGEGVLMAAELATVVIGGLFSSTVLTLLVVPTVYAVVNRVRPTAAGED